MYKFNEFPPTPGSVEPAANFSELLREVGSQNSGAILGSLVMTNTGGRIYQTESVCASFVETHIGNPAIAANFMEGARAAFTSPALAEEGR